MSEIVYTWEGEPLTSDTDPARLLEVIGFLAQQIETAHKDHARTLSMWAECSKARAARKP